MGLYELNLRIHVQLFDWPKDQMRLLGQGVKLGITDETPVFQP